MARWKPVTAALGAAVLLAAGAARADDYPNRPVTLVVPFAPGGSTTIMARIVAEKMATTLGQQVIIDNRGGAGGTIGARQVAKSAPDGYTILLGYSGTLAIGPTLYRDPGFDPRKDFVAIGRIGSSSRSPRRGRARSISPRRASARSAISRPSCSRIAPASGSITSLIKGQDRA
jgi:tripartite-type tricarboxylate transporter receptor subunit TctC